VRPGEAKNSWLTGTAAWTYVAIAHYILGVRAEFDGLRVCPSLDATLTDVKVTRRCRGALYRIAIRNKGAGHPRLKVDGKSIEGTLVPYARPGATVEVEVEC
jgi:cellobiose phosphorylase